MSAISTKGEQDLQEVLVGAVRSGSLESLQEIISKSSSCDERRELINKVVRTSSETILHIAACHRQKNIVEWLLSEQGGRAAGCNNILVPCAYDQYTALHVVVESGDLATCKAIMNGCRADNGERAEMLNAVTNRKCTVLHLGAENDRLDIIEWLLLEREGGGRALGFVSVLARTTDQSTALHLSRTPATFHAVLNGCRADNGERETMLNAMNIHGKTVLHLAACRNQPSIISWLLSEEKGGAAGFNRSNIAAVTTDVSASVLHLAMGAGAEGVRTLLSHCTQQERTNLFLAVDDRGWTPLHYGARKHRHECIIKLFQHAESKVIANKKDNTGMTVLHRAIIGGLDEDSRKKWYPFHFKPSPVVIAALLGSAETGWTSIDPNIGLGNE